MIQTWQVSFYNEVKAEALEAQNTINEISSNCESAVINATDATVNSFIEYLEGIQVSNSIYCWNRLRATYKAIQEAHGVPSETKKRLRTIMLSKSVNL